MILNTSLNEMIKPIWYFNLEVDSGKNTYWIDHNKINPKYLKILDENNFYESKKSFSFDLAYQLWHRGVIDYNEKILLDIKSDELTSINDQYIFSRRMFKSRWIYFSFILRMFLFKVSVKEIKVLFKTRLIKKINLNKPIYEYDDYDSFQSKFILEKRNISIIIPTLNRYRYLDSALKNLESQNYKNFEVIIVDQSDNFNSEFYNKFNLNINLIHQKQKGLWLARNRAIKKAKGEYLLFFDDDSTVNSNWVLEHIKCLDYFGADISAGVSKSKIGSPIPVHYNYFRWADQLDTGNVLIKREVFQKCGLFDSQFEGMRMGDGEFGLRAYLKGFKSINNPKAERTHLKVSFGGLREMGSWDGIRSTSFFQPIPIPSLIYFFRKYWGTKKTIIFLLQIIPISLSPYILKGKKSGHFLSFLIFFITLPVIFIRLYKSWMIAEKMLFEGESIELFK